MGLDVEGHAPLVLGLLVGRAEHGAAREHDLHIHIDIKTLQAGPTFGFKQQGCMRLTRGSRKTQIRVIITTAVNGSS